MSTVPYPFGGPKSGTISAAGVWYPVPYPRPTLLMVDVAFMVLFGVFRICVGSNFLYTYYQQDTDFLGRLGGTIIYSIGWVFWLSIVQYGYKKYQRKYGSGRRKKVKARNAQGRNMKQLQTG